MQPTDELGQFIRDQQPPVVLRRPFPACMHNPLRSSDAGNQPSNFGGVYDDECLQQTPVHWNFGHARSGADNPVHYLDRATAEGAAKNPFKRLLKWLRNSVKKS